jgi:hypothetical protein
MNNMKKLLLLGVLLLNLMPYMKDGQLQLETTQQVKGQDFIVEGMVGQLYLCVLKKDPNDMTQWFYSDDNVCDMAEVCTCAYCHKQKDCNKACASTEPCGVCGKPVLCGSICMEPNCGKKDDDVGRENDPTSSESGSSGSSSGESGSTTNPSGTINPGGNGNPGNTSTHKLTALAISKSALTGLNKILSTDMGLKLARCNQGVQESFKAAFGFLLQILNCKANPMIVNLRNSTNWTPISKAEAQSAANSGYFVIAGWYNSNGSGHVVVIVPGTAVNGWPQGMETGDDKRWESKPINNSFGRDKRDDLEYFKYK